MIRNHHRHIVWFVLVPAILWAALGCASQRKVARIRSDSVAAAIQLPESRSFVPEVKDIPSATRDTLKVTDLDGKELLIMRAVKDDATGEMVATEELQAATVTARFRNIAERHGRIDLEFQVIVPRSMQDSRWQLRFHPDMYMLGDSLRLDDVLITGRDYRKAQLRGYQQYERWLSSIITDSTHFIDMRNLEIFTQRNIPAIYAFRSDSSVVSDELFYSYFGVSEREAVEHYTNRLAKRRNERRSQRREKMFRKFIKTPIVSEGIRLDTVITSDGGDVIYNYIQTIQTRRNLRKVDIVLSGEIYEQDERLYTMPPGEPLTFYISSVSTLVDSRERYLTKVISRRASANTTARIAFRSGRDEIDESLEENASEIRFIKANLRSLLESNEFELDSITISSSASPEGSEQSNNALSLRRSRSASRYFDTFVQYVLDSLRREEGLFVTVGEDLSEGAMRHSERTSRQRIRFISRSGGENWHGLDLLVDADTLLTDEQKEEYRSVRSSVADADLRERELFRKSFYPRIRDTFYPKLRTVRFDFALHRRGMVKDTVHTTEPDTLYRRGVELLRDHEYEQALAILRPYQDYNTAVAFVALDYNKSALAILRDCEKTAPVNYMLALLYSREADDQNAVQCFLNACREDPSYVYRGNLDPEISALVKKYNLNADPGDDDWGDLN